MSNNTVPEGMPSLPFGMKWDHLLTGSGFKADVCLDGGFRIEIEAFESRVDFDKRGYGKWKGGMTFSFLYSTHRVDIATQPLDTVQDAAKAAVDLLAPFTLR